MSLTFNWVKKPTKRKKLKVDNEDRFFLLKSGGRGSNNLAASKDSDFDFPDGKVVKNLTAYAGDLGSIAGSGRFPGERNGNPLQYFCLENPMDRGTWWAIVHGVAKSQTQLSNSATTTKTLKGVPGGACGKDPPASAGDTKDAG